MKSILSFLFFLSVLAASAQNAQVVDSNTDSTNHRKPLYRPARNAEEADTSHKRPLYRPNNQQADSSKKAPFWSNARNTQQTDSSHRRYSYQPRNQQADSGRQKAPFWANRGKPQQADSTAPKKPSYWSNFGKKPQQPAANPQPVAQTPSGQNIVKTIGNGIGFEINSCIGNPQDQTVTLSFTFSNPSKPHQMIALYFQKYPSHTNALDNESKEYSAGLITIGGQSFSNVYGNCTKQLPTGNVLKGSITFTNVLPMVNLLSLVNIITESYNSTGGGDKQLGITEVQNVPVSWATKN